MDEVDDEDADVVEADVELGVVPGGLVTVIVVTEPEDPVEDPDDSADATAADSYAAFCGVIWTKCHRYTL